MPVAPTAFFVGRAFIRNRQKPLFFENDFAELRIQINFKAKVLQIATRRGVPSVLTALASFASAEFGEKNLLRNP